MIYIDVCNEMHKSRKVSPQDNFRMKHGQSLGHLALIYRIFMNKIRP